MQQLRNMGDLQDLLGMIPGMGNLKNVQIDEKAMARTAAMIQSMTPYERDNPSCLNHSRKQRICKGSGVSPADLNHLLKQFDMMNDMMRKMNNPKLAKKMRRMGGMRGGFPGFPM